MSMIKNLNRYTEIGWFLIKYGRSDLVSKAGIKVPLRPSKPENITASELKRDLQNLGPTFIKFGQLLSTQFELLPDEYQEALQDLQDNAERFPYGVVRQRIQEEFGLEIEDIFLEFDPEPLAAASLSQVHRAVLKSGRDVVVKIQRPDIEEKVKEDIEILLHLAEIVDKHNLLGKNYFLADKVKIFQKILLIELDFVKESQTLATLRHNLEEMEGIIVPQPIPDYTTSRVLTMEYISSKKITSLHPIVTMELDGQKLAETLFKAYLKQIFIDGLVHVDPHPGNVYLTDTKEIALLDVGMVDYFSHQIQQDLLQLLLSMSDGKGEEACHFIIKMGLASDQFDAYRYQEEISDLIARYHDLKWMELGIGKLFLKISSASAEHGLRLSSKFNTLGKVLANLDMIIRRLAPEFDSNKYLREQINELFQERIKNTFSKETIYRILMNGTEMVTKLPYKVNELLDSLSQKEIRIKLQPVDEFRFLNVFEKIANRIALGLVISSLIIGAALLMRIQTEFQLFGYPGLAILLFMGAAFGGAIFIFNVVKSDHKTPE